MPIVEPEVTLGPGDYTIEETAYWSERVYSHVFRLLNEYDVMLVRSTSPDPVMRTVQDHYVFWHYAALGLTAREWIGWTC